MPQGHQTKMLRTTNHREPTRALSYNQSNNFLSVLLHFLYLSLSPGSHSWKSAPNHIRFGTALFQIINVQTNSNFLICQFIFNNIYQGFYRISYFVNCKVILFSLIGLYIPELQFSMNTGSFRMPRIWCLNDKQMR